MVDGVGKLVSRWDTVKGLRMHTRVSVEPVPLDRPPLILVHGLSVSSRYMIPTARTFAPHMRVYSPDFPGFGESEKPRKVFSIPELADILAAWMEVVGIDHAPMIANSLGCQVVIDFALRYSRCIDRGILIAPTMDRHARTGVQQFVRLVRDSVREPISQPFVVLGDYLRTGFVRTIKTLRYALNDPIEQKLPSVGVPMLILRGEHDPIVPQRWAEEVASLLPRGGLAVIADEAHTINYSAPEKLLVVSREFLGLDDGLRVSA
jgi:2-hydroxy-6-oxonona-2,4-dienedioate hydrolase